MWRARLTSGRFHFAAQAGDTKTWVLCGSLITFCYRKAVSFFLSFFCVEVCLFTCFIELLAPWVALFSSLRWNCFPVVY